MPPTVDTKIKQENRQKYVIAAVFTIMVIAGITYITLSKKDEPLHYGTPSPGDVVRQYFSAWNSKDYPNMYATLSDGFKRIDPNAKDLSTFINFASSQGIEGVRIIGIKEKSNYGDTAVVDYSVEFTLSDNRKQNFSDKFNLKFRQGDVIQGWKLIHPYGQNIDVS